MKFINVYMDHRGLWSASLCSDAEDVLNITEIDNIGGSYPKAINAERDAKNSWGRDLEVRASYSPVFFSNETRSKIMHLLDDGLSSKEVAERLGIKAASLVGAENLLCLQ